MCDVCVCVMCGCVMCDCVMCGVWLCDVWCGALVDLMGTPGYLAPEMLKVSVEDDATGYGKEIDL